MEGSAHVIAERGDQRVHAEAQEYRRPGADPVGERAEAEGGRHADELRQQQGGDHRP